MPNDKDRTTRWIPASEREKEITELRGKVRSELKAAWLDGYITGVEVAADHAIEARRSKHDHFDESDIAIDIATYSEGETP